ncbi:hypothetical protein T484DRAFT_1757234 [Baffinella frigidus]|nr:hypothetical protein T484DRAFT_1757234 [Cryptophyta sp. CCMP2293]
MVTQPSLVQHTPLADPPPQFIVAMSLAEKSQMMRDKFIAIFFKDNALQRLVVHFSNTCSVQYVDPITTIVTIMLKNSVQCAINEQGICPFKSHPTMTFPFSLMNKEQHSFLTTIQLPENRAAVSTHALMGGGRMLLFYEQVPIYYIPHSDALVEMCKATLANNTYAAEQRLQVCNIVLQRVAAIVNISNSTLKHVNQSLRSRIVEIQQ